MIISHGHHLNVNRSNITILRSTLIVGIGGGGTHLACAHQPASKKCPLYFMIGYKWDVSAGWIGWRTISFSGREQMAVEKYNLVASQFAWKYPESGSPHLFNIQDPGNSNPRLRNSVKNCWIHIFHFRIMQNSQFQSILCKEEEKEEEVMKENEGLKKNYDLILWKVLWPTDLPWPSHRH